MSTELSFTEDEWDALTPEEQEIAALQQQIDTVSNRTISDPRIKGVWLSNAHYMVVTPEQMQELMDLKVRNYTKEA